MKLPIACLAAIMLILGGVVLWAIHSESQFDSNCTDKGGHVVELSRDSICVSPDGRVIGSD